VKPIRVTFFGDSICVGQYISIHSGWVVKISEQLCQLSLEMQRPIVVSNSSANGRTTRQALEHIGYEIQSHQVDLLLVQFGMNDCNYWRNDRGLPRVGPEAFAANLREIIERAYHFGTDTVFLNTNHPTSRDCETIPYTDITYEESNRKYNDLIREVAATCGAPTQLNDVEKVFREYVGDDKTRLVELLLPEPDGLHLSQKGHDLYFETIYPRLETAVQRLTDKSDSEQRQ